MKIDHLNLKMHLARLRQRLFGRPVDIRESWEKTPADYEDMVASLDRFERAQSIDETVEHGRVDWIYCFANNKYFEKIPKETALEIGFGGGRILTHAAREFADVIGIDIHDNFAPSERFLASQGTTNCRLLKHDQFVAIVDRSINFVYSFIVFQHFDSVGEVNFYLSHITHVLSPRGVAQIYYGKKAGEGIDVTTPDWLRLRDCSLFIVPGTMRGIVAEKFQVLEYRDSLPCACSKRRR